MVVRKASLFSLPSSFAARAGAIVRETLNGIHHKESIKLLKIDEVEEYREGGYIAYGLLRQYRDKIQTMRLQ